MKKLINTIITIMLIVTMVCTNVNQAQAQTNTYKGNESASLAKGAYTLTIKNNSKQTISGDINSLPGSSYKIDAGKSKIVTFVVSKAQNAELNTNNSVSYTFQHHTQGGSFGSLNTTKTIYGTSNGDNSTISYYTFKPTKKGYLEGSIISMGSDNATTYIKICDANGKSLTGGWAPRSNKMNKSVRAVGVQANKVYKLAVKTSNKAYKISLKVTFRRFRGGSTIKKALNMKRKRAYPSMVLAGNSVRWYKVKVNEARVLRVKISQRMFANPAQPNGIQVNVYRGSKRIKIDRTDYKYKANVMTIVYGYDLGKATKGVYYFRVSGYGKSTGYYNIKVN